MTEPMIPDKDALPYGWDNPAPGTALWRLLNYPDTLTLAEALVGWRAALSARAALAAAEAAPLAGLTPEEMDALRARVEAEQIQDAYDRGKVEAAPLDVERLVRAMAAMSRKYGLWSPYENINGERTADLLARAYATEDVP